MSKVVGLLGGSILAVSMLTAGFPLLGDELYIDTSSGISLFDINAVLGGATSPSGTFGPSGAVTGFSDNQGNVWVVSFASGVSTVQKYDGSGNPIAGSEFQVAAALQNGVVGPNNNLYFAGASGEIYAYSANTLMPITNWNIATGNPNLSGTQYSAIGIAFDGTNLDTTEGDAGTFIDKWNASGSLQSSVNVGVSSLYGLGQDGKDFFAGTPGDVLEFDATSGDPLNSFAIGGSNFSLSAGPAPVAVQPPPPPPPPPPTVPEPGTIPLVLLAGLMAATALLRKRGAWMLLRRISIRRAGWALAVVVLPAAYGQINLNIITSTNTAAIGQQITVSASASDPTNHGTFTYQFNVLPPGLSNYSLVRDYSPVNSFPFTTTEWEGVYTIQVNALESTAAGPLTKTLTTQLSFTPVATTVPVVSATAHPLVAMYSLPPCPVGSQARVHFRLAGTIFWSYTPYQNCTGNTSLNFLVGGMRGSSTYTLQHDIVSGSGDALGPVMSYTTQAIPTTVKNDSPNSPIPPFSVSVPATGPNATAYPVLLTGVIGNNGIPVGVAGPRTPFAVDMAGQVIWYLPDFAAPPTAPLQEQGYMTRPVPGGTFLVIANQTVQADKQLLREYDLAGNILRETNATAIANELAALGKERITSISHEIFRFPNGDTGFIGSIERKMASAYDSTTNTVHSNVDVLGDMAVVLDTNFHVKWSWDAFDKHGKPFATTWPSGGALPAFTGLLDEVCAPGAGCPNLININPATGKVYAGANDWLHSNSLAPTPDGNLIISLRHQDMVVKINYSNGSGDGSILWRLGPEGDFATSVPGNQTPFQFFNTHQHDAEYEANGVLSLFDNGNTRISLYSGNSRGQAWQIDEANKTATPVVDIDLGSFSLATGSAQRLANNNYHFYLGYIDFSAPNSQSVEVTTSGADEFKLALPNALGYRSFRMATLYSISGQVVYTPFFAVPPGH